MCNKDHNEGFGVIGWIVFSAVLWTAIIIVLFFKSDFS